MGRQIGPVALTKMRWWFSKRDFFSSVSYENVHVKMSFEMFISMLWSLFLKEMMLH